MRTSERWLSLNAVAGAALLALGATGANAQALRLGVAAPLSGASAVLGEQIRDGASTAIEAGGEETLEVVDDGCTGEGGAAAAQRFVAVRVQAVVGFLCSDAIEAAMPILQTAGIPVITVGVRTDRLTDDRAKTGWPVFRLGPRADGEQKALAALLPKLWRDEFFAIVDDGTIYGRELAESFRLAAEQAALKAVYVDTFRPQLDNQIGLVGRLRRSGATHVFVGGDRDDVAIMARDAAELDAGLSFAGGEALRAAASDVPLAAGTIMIGLPEWAEAAGPGVVEALRARQIEPEGYVLPAYAAVKIARLAIAESTQTGRPVAETLGDRNFETVLGPVKFSPTGDLSENPYRAFRFDGARFVPIETP